MASIIAFIKRFRKFLIFGLLFCLAALAAWGLTTLLRGSTQDLVSESVAAEIEFISNEPIQPIPLELELDEVQVALGDKLFHDPVLSNDYSMSCATCHDLNKGGTDRLPTSIGMAGHKTPLNSPTVFNSGFQFRQMWDGRDATLEDQVEGPIASIGEMGGTSWQEVLRRVSDVPEYVQAFDDTYTDGITPETIKSAIATYERSLYTPNAPFDKYLRGDKEAISAEAKQGYGLFKSYGCVTCHQGVLLGGNMYQTLGVFGDYFADRGTPVIKADLGRYNVTQDENDRHVFKVPTLRNIELTAPYFHDGQVRSLDDAIKIMGKYQLGVDMPQDDVDAIMQFLRSLTGTYQGKSL